jgi:hypothetical protein
MENVLIPIYKVAKFENSLTSKASVPKFERIYEEKEEYTLFIIEVKTRDGHSWRVSKRFSDFVDMHAKMTKISNKMPNLPPKTLFPLKNDKEIENRRLLLDEYTQVSVQTYLTM